MRLEEKRILLGHLTSFRVVLVMLTRDEIRDS